MSDTRLISLRMPKELLTEIDLIAEVEKRSRAQVIILKLQGNATATGIERQREQGGANLVKAVVNGRSAGNTGEAENNSRVDERGVGGGVAESDAGVVLTGRLRSVAGGGGGAAAGEKKRAKKTVAAKISEEAAVGAGWFPNSMCPHGWMNSFACEKNNVGCKR